jgi:hypothetical protein
MRWAGSIEGICRKFKNEKNQKLIFSIHSGSSDRNILFDDLITLLLYLNFNSRIKGNHHIFFKEGIDEIINIQPDGN